MKGLLSFMLLTTAMLPALSQAKAVNIYDRAPQVRDEILSAPGASDCAAVTAAQLAGINNLCFMGNPSLGCRPGYAHNPILALTPSDLIG